MNIKERLDQKREVIDRELASLLSRDDSLLYEAMRYAVFSGGKRFRPLLTLAAGECFDVELKTALPFACALELVHNYSLIHDDLPSMDNDDFRRGKPSCHKKFGEDIALLAGNGLLTLAFEVMSEAHLEDRNFSIGRKIIQIVSRFSGVEGTIGGQFLDITFPPKKMPLEDFQALISKKTGALITASVMAGALLGNPSAAILDFFKEYGENLGLAFQIRDDISDSFEDRALDEKARPNFVSLYGINEANRYLKRYIELAVVALHRVSLPCEELCFLAHRLLDTKEASGNGKIA